MYIGICHPGKNIQFLVLSIVDQEKYWYFCNQVTIIDYNTHAVYMTLKINWFSLISINLRDNYFYIINEIMGWFFCRDIYSIYLKRFWGNFRIIQQIYKYEAFEETFKFINQLWILNNFFIEFSSNLLNPEKASSFVRTEFLIGIFL